MLSRAGMFRVTEGLGVDMKDRVYELHSFHSKFNILFTWDILLLVSPKLIIVVFPSPLHILQLWFCVKPILSTSAILQITNPLKIVFFFFFFWQKNCILFYFFLFSIYTIVYFNIYFFYCFSLVVALNW